MKKIYSMVVLLLTCIAITSCSDNEDLSTAGVRDYQTDAQVLSRFVDVNKTLGEYYINENKKNSPLSYLTNQDWQELQNVAPANKMKFESDLKELNGQLASAAQRSDVSQIVYTTNNETWIRNLQNDAPFMIEKGSSTETRATRSLARMQLYYGGKAYASFTTGRRIQSTVNINLFGYKYYFIEVLCKMDASKEQSGAGGGNPKAIVLSGMASMESYIFYWNANGSNSSVYWDFEGKQNAPQDMNNLITVDFN